jgi:hypothetical protein
MCMYILGEHCILQKEVSVRCCEWKIEKEAISYSLVRICNLRCLFMNRHLVFTISYSSIHNPYNQLQQHT